MKLISMTDYVLEQINTNQFDEDFTSKVVNYAKFLKQPLTLGMFVPCDEDCIFLDEPDYVSADDGNEEDINYVEKYQQAKERVLFDGFMLCYVDNFVHTVSLGNQRNSLKINFKKKNVLIHRDKLLVNTLEDLVKYNLTLTESAIKTYGI